MTLNSVGRSESVSTNVRQATQLNRSRAEQVGTIDNLTRFLNKTLDEGLVVKDADKREVNRSIDEVVGFNNRVEVIQELFRSQVEQIGATDQLSFLLLSDLPELISIIDQSRTLTAKPVSEFVGAEDSIERIGAFERLQEETTQLNDETTQFTAKSFFEQTTLTDVTDSLLGKPLLESLSVDDRERKSVLVDFDETLQFNINLLSERASFVRQVENISPQDAPVGRSAQLFRNRSEAFQLQDFLNRQLDLFRDIVDDLSLQDSLSFLLERRQTATTSLVDTQSTLTQKAVQESFDAIDEVGKFATLLRRQSAVVSVLDSDIKDIAKPLFEGIDVNDSVVREADYSRRRQEQVDLTDLQLTKYLTFKQEQVRVEDNVLRVSEYLRELSQTFDLEDRFDFLYRAKLAETVTFDIDLSKLISLREEAKINTQPLLEFRKFFPEVPLKSLIEFIGNASKSEIEFIGTASEEVESR
jgi:hypothetical protein